MCVYMCIIIYVGMCRYLCLYMLCVCVFVFVCVLIINKAEEAPKGSENLVRNLSWHPGWVSISAMGHRADQCH